MNRARNADHPARTHERFVYSIVKIIRLYNYQTWQTHFWRGSRGVQRLCGLFFSTVLFGCWLAQSRRTPITWVEQVQFFQWVLLYWITSTMTGEIYYFPPCWTNGNYSVCVVLHEKYRYLMLTSNVTELTRHNSQRAVSFYINMCCHLCRAKRHVCLPYWITKKRRGEGGHDLFMICLICLLYT